MRARGSAGAFDAGDKNAGLILGDCFHDGDGWIPILDNATDRETSYGRDAKLLERGRAGVKKCGCLGRSTGVENNQRAVKDLGK